MNYEMNILYKLLLNPHIKMLKFSILFLQTTNQTCINTLQNITYSLFNYSVCDDFIELHRCNKHQCRRLCFKKHHHGGHSIEITIYVVYNVITRKWLIVTTLLQPAVMTKRLIVTTLLQPAVTTKRLIVTTLLQPSVTTKRFIVTTFL